MQYQIKRYDVKGFCYGESIFRSKKKKDCLKYLKNVFESNKKWYIKIERERDTFTVYKKENILHYAILPDRN